MNKDRQRFGLYQPARYQIKIVGHLDSKRATWFENLSLTSGYDENGTPITAMEGEIRDQTMLHGLLAKIRDLGLPLLAINRIQFKKENR